MLAQTTVLRTSGLARQEFAGLVLGAPGCELNVGVLLFRTVTANAHLKAFSQLHILCRGSPHAEVDAMTELAMDSPFYSQASLLWTAHKHKGHTFVRVPRTNRSIISCLVAGTASR